MIDDGLTFIANGGTLEPRSVDLHMKVPNELADKAYSPPPDWVVDRLRSTNRCEPFPKSKRHHVGVWELLVRRLPVTAQAKGVASVLAEHWPNISPSLARISALSGHSRSSCDNGVYILQLAGLLQLDSKVGQKTVYVPCYPARAITAGEVEFAKKWRRNGRTPPAQPASTSDGENDGGTCFPVGHLPAQPAAPPVSRLDPTCPTGGREVNNEAHNQDSERSPVVAAVPDAYRASPASRRAHLVALREANG